MQPLGVVFLDIPGYQGPGLFKLRKSRLSEAFGLQGFVEAFNFSVALGMTNAGGCRPDLPLLEIGFERPGQVLGAIIGDQARTRVVFWQGALGPFPHNLDIPGFHGQANLVMDNRS